MPTCHQIPTICKEKLSVPMMRENVSGALG